MAENGIFSFFLSAVGISRVSLHTVFFFDAGKIFYYLLLLNELSFNFSEKIGSSYGRPFKVQLICIFCGSAVTFQALSEGESGWRGLLSAECIEPMNYLFSL